MKWRQRTDYHGSRPYASDLMHEVHDTECVAPTFGSWLKEKLETFLRSGAAESVIAIDLMREEQRAFPLFEPVGQPHRRNADVACATPEEGPRANRLGAVEGSHIRNVVPALPRGKRALPATIVE